MVYDYSKLKARIVELFGTQQNFAKALGTNDAYVSKKLKNQSQFKQADIIKWCELLKIEPYEVGIYFFTLIVA